jgi:hypothetical protein
MSFLENEKDIKEKSREIFLNFYTVELEDGTHLDKEAAKDCALIMVKEITKITASTFWYRVKNEIEKM